MKTAGFPVNMYRLWCVMLLAMFFGKAVDASKAVQTVICALKRSLSEFSLCIV